MTYNGLTLNDHIFAQPAWPFYWIMWLVIINFAAVLFVIRRKDGKLGFGPIEAPLIIVAMVANAIFMSWLFSQVGYVRLLGLSHIVFWTPLVLFLWMRLNTHEPGSPFRIYLSILILTNVASLIIDFIDVGRYLTDNGTLA